MVAQILLFPADICRFLPTFAPIVIPLCDTKLQIMSNMKYPTTRIVFDRKHLSSKTKVGLVQVEVLYERKRKYISTGVKVYKDQWTDKSHVVSRQDSVSLNKRIAELKARIDSYINGLIEHDDVFDFAAFDSWLRRTEENSMNFLEWLAQRIDGRTDIRESSKRTQRKLMTALSDFGRIRTFADLTANSVSRFDAWLHQKGLKQSSVWSYHKTLRTYVNEAMRLELLTKSPYLNFKVDKGKTEWGMFLTEEELEQMSAAHLPTESLERVRDLFLMQCLTGMAYADLISFDFSNARSSNDGLLVFSGERQKTGASFTIVLLPQALDILAKYNYTLPQISIQQYNMRLKVIADAAGIDKPIASHYGRRTCGMLLLNKGFPIEIVAKVLGHTNIRTTQQAYARILDSSVEREFAQRMGIGNKDTHE